MIHRVSRIRHHVAMATSAALLSMMLAPAAHASGSSMPWEAPLQSILQSIGLALLSRRLALMFQLLLLELVL